MAFAPPAHDLDAYARLVVEVGAGVVPGQRTYVLCDVAHAPFARALTAAAYKAGAAYVDVLYQDQLQVKSHIEHAPFESLNYSPPWAVARFGELADSCAGIRVVGTADPEAFATLPPERVAEARQDELQASLMAAISTQKVNWTIAGYPTAGWAEKVYGEPDVDRLWAAIRFMARLDAPDPVQAMRERLAVLLARARTLEEADFDYLRFQGPGTDLKIGLIPKGRWLAVSGETVDGVPYVPNIPSEEIFTSPDRRRVEGSVRATLPLEWRGAPVEGLALTFADGKIVDVVAETGAELIRSTAAVDEGACRLGEVALVDNTGRVSDTGTLFYNTLYDENAASHLAFGTGFPFCAPEGADADEVGINASSVHVDFMIGSDEVTVEGAPRGGGALVPILLRGDWVLNG